MMEIISRAEAARAGAITYFTGKPCRRGHLEPKYVSCATCVECQRIANPSKRWRAENHARLIARARAQAIRRKQPTLIAKDFDYMSTLPLFEKAYRLSKKTGVPHVVGYIKAPCLGGKYTASNLKVLPWKKNVVNTGKARRASRR